MPSRPEKSAIIFWARSISFVINRLRVQLFLANVV